MPIVFFLFAGLMVKHYFADFVLQPQWMLNAKGRLDVPGGYAHAALHAAGTGIVLAFCGIELVVALAIMAVEAVVHFALDYSKDFYTRHSDVDRNPARYWQLHGLDQLAHQMTYVIIAWVAMSSLG